MRRAPDASLDTIGVAPFLVGSLLESAHVAAVSTLSARRTACEDE